MQRNKQKQHKCIRIPVSDYAKEIITDLDDLIAEYPAGIYIAHLTDYYGETISRTLGAVRLLESQAVVKMSQAVSGAYFVLPIGYIPIVEMPELTEQQRALVIYILRLCQQNKTQLIQTNYGQLARIMQSSYGGLRMRIQRLIDLNYFEMVKEPQRGKQHEMLIKLGAKLYHYGVLPENLVQLDSHLDNKMPS